MSTPLVVAGFSKLNRWLLYTSLMLAPAQYVSGLGSNCPSNIGFLAYNWYTQIQWYQAVQARQLHALSLLLPHFNLIYAITYLGGVTSGNVYMGALLGLGTMGVLGLNTAAAWISWKTNQIEGFGIFHFFFFGWRTLTPNWHKFFLCWQIFDTLTAVGCGITSLVTAISVAAGQEEEPPWYMKYVLIPVGSAIVLFGAWPLILWTELIVNRNQIESATDWTAVYLFIAQVGAMLVPSCSGCWGRVKQWKKSPKPKPQNQAAMNLGQLDRLMAKQPSTTTEPV